MTSIRLEEFFKQYDPVWLHDFFKTIFGYTYSKTHPNGLYMWLGASPQEFDRDLTIDKGAAACTVYQKWGSINGSRSLIIYIFIHHNEQQVINKFTKSLKLKAFL